MSETVAESPTKPSYKGTVDRLTAESIRGWCVGSEGAPASIQVWIDGRRRATVAADIDRHDLVAHGICSEGGGFDVPIANWLPDAETVDIRVTAPDGRVLPGGRLALSRRDRLIAGMEDTFSSLPKIKIGVFGDRDFAIKRSKGSVFSKILLTLDATPTEGSDGDEDCNIWFGVPHHEKPRRALINGAFADSSKSHIDMVHQRVFGRSMTINPAHAVSNQPYVLKSDTNAMHDGRVVLGRDITEVPAGSVLQRLIDNRISDDFVRDFRAVVIGKTIPFVYLKDRPVVDRFSNTNSRAAVTLPSTVLSTEEQRLILDFCRTLDLDYGELDTLRDRNTGDLWIVDVNNTPAGPPNGLRHSDVTFAVREMALAFYREFVRPAA